ncbi:MAG: HNH endonuclease [Deltaproteobacteria bacterium]|nr:HNH endonuclease [bacterium]MCB9476288.1 HNH endonuclease [Deltaproteobacteria bacterium]MCB9479979.1 HNH endonuclease [Deltaproteobacteria bacterium]MCB9489248.1 HNH endonuclease [Deltaproteobacteria bacterium]
MTYAADIPAISFDEMCAEEGVYLQRGMYYRHRPDRSVVLISSRDRSGYFDACGQSGSMILYQGHNAMRSKHVPYPDLVDQPERTQSGAPTVNGHFVKAASDYRAGAAAPEAVAIYKKLASGVWLAMGLYWLVDAWDETHRGRRVFKFKFLRDKPFPRTRLANPAPRRISARVRAAVWNRDEGRCVICGSGDQLHFDHIVPVAKGGANTSANIRLLCARHNLLKSDHIAGA